MLAATFLAIFFVPMFYKIITARRLRESRSTAELQAEAQLAHHRAPAHADDLRAPPADPSIDAAQGESA